jgi:3HB-oligomer hydrolase (3HBOH)
MDSSLPDSSPLVSFLPKGSRHLWAGALALAALTLSPAPVAAAPSRCEQVLTHFGSRLADATCTESPDLTTANANTTPADNAIPSLPPGAFTPQADRDTISPERPDRTPINGPVPGVQINARIADDPHGQARILFRLPNEWNGRLVVVGAPGTRSEFNGDYAWSDYVIQRGYAYVAQNKGVLNARVTTGDDPLACRLNPTPSGREFLLHFYDNEPGQPFTRWTTFMAQAARLGREAVQAHYGRPAQYSYAVGTSNGGYQVRRALEANPELFDGGVDWEGTFVDAEMPNLLSTLPPAVLNYPNYEHSRFNADSKAARNILAAGYPPDLVDRQSAQPKSFWQIHYATYWEVTICQWQKRLDPTYGTYSTGLGNYVFIHRLAASDVGKNLADIATTGRIRKPLITVVGTMDALLPIDTNARQYARRVAAAANSDGDKAPSYRLYEVQNGNHIEKYKTMFPQLELIQPHAQRAFDLLVGAVEGSAELPPSQCIPRGGKIESSPKQAGNCRNLLAP